MIKHLIFVYQIRNIFRFVIKDKYYRFVVILFIFG